MFSTKSVAIVFIIKMINLSFSQLDGKHSEFKNKSKLFNYWDLLDFMINGNRTKRGVNDNCGYGYVPNSAICNSS